ncbi:hypothetical protein F2Q69_00032187 [Brassica cretica]|uniref:Rho GDP-dissociation inhibitor 1 n=1 Tax=Brassica cretica TaxID=69181 RepID=A0A8S9RSK2_BRACR|nr:hypothetical protein F2Q69_00032187 [Brassica cretica]
MWLCTLRIGIHFLKDPGFRAFAGLRDPFDDLCCVVLKGYLDDLIDCVKPAVATELGKDDESLRKWKEQLLGSVDVTNIGETLDPEVKIISLAILSPGRPDIVLMVPENGNPKGMWFTLKEGSKYCLKFTFQVKNNIVSGLRYTNTVWKTGVKVDRGKEMLGTFSPQSEPYNHVMPEETTPSGMFARGSYSARTKFLDDDNKCYLEINYSFDIRKEWPAV